MKYTFNYKDYSERYYNLVKETRGSWFDIAKGEMRSYSKKLHCYSYGNDKKDFLFPIKTESFTFNLTKSCKKKLGKVLESNGYSNFKIFAVQGSFPIFIDKNNGNVFSSIGTTFINSSLEQFAESFLFYEEFREEEFLFEEKLDANENIDSDEDVREFDWLTEDTVLDLFAKIERIDKKAVKPENFWHDQVSLRILFNEIDKMMRKSKGLIPKKVDGVRICSLETIPSVLDLPAWKALHPQGICPCCIQRYRRKGTGVQKVFDFSEPG